LTSEVVGWIRVGGAQARIGAVGAGDCNNIGVLPYSCNRRPVCLECLSWLDHGCIWRYRSVYVVTKAYRPDDGAGVGPVHLEVDRLAGKDVQAWRRLSVNPARIVDGDVLLDCDIANVAVDKRVVLSREGVSGGYAVGIDDVPVSAGRVDLIGCSRSEGDREPLAGVQCPRAIPCQVESGVYVPGDCWVCVGRSVEKRRAGDVLPAFRQVVRGINLRNLVPCYRDRYVELEGGIVTHSHLRWVGCLVDL